MEEKKDIKSMPLERLREEMAARGEKAFRTGQLYQWMHVKLAQSFDEMTNLPKSFREECAGQYAYTRLETVKLQESGIDGTKKFLFRLGDGQMVESVWMRYRHGNSVCISSQVGCRMGCAFCASTIAGKVRDLTPGELLDQVVFTGKDSGAGSPPAKEMISGFAVRASSSRSTEVSIC